MKKVVIELDEKYKPLVEDIKIVKGVPSDEYYKHNYPENVAELSMNWFGNNLNIIKTIERIHSADEIEFVEARYCSGRAESDGYYVNEDGGISWESNDGTRGLGNILSPYQAKAVRVLFDKWSSEKV